MGVGNVERLDTLLQSNGRDGELKLALSRLHVDLRARCESGSPLSRDFIVAALRTLPRIKGSKHSIVRMECLNQCAQYLYVNGHTIDALIAANQLVSLSRLSQNRQWVRLAESVFAIVQADLGNVADAVIHYSRSLDLARELGNFCAEVCTLTNLGVALNYAGLYREAIPFLARAEALAGSDPETRSTEPTAAANLAQSYLYLEQYSDAFDAITRALRLSSAPTDSESALSLTIRESTFVQIALELGKFDLARVHSQSCKNFANQCRSDRARFISNVTSALCDIYCGDANEGIRELEQALQHTFKNNSDYIDGLTFLVKAYDRIGRFADALECMNKLIGHIRSVRQKSVIALLTATSGAIDASDLQSEASDLGALQYKAATLKARVAEEKLFGAQIETLERLAVAADLKEEASGQHGYRVGKLSALLAKDIGWSPEECFTLEIATRLHDIGKIGVPDRILFSSDELRSAQRQFMSAHTAIGAELLAQSQSPVIRVAEDVARRHHEWWNGQGYPSKLSGKRISIHARIASLADVFDALTHGRPYAEAWTADAALAEIAKRGGTQFDPMLTDRFLALMAHLRSEHEDLDAFLALGADTSSFAQARKRLKAMLSTARQREVRQVAMET